MPKTNPPPIGSSGSRPASPVKRLNAWLKTHRPDYYGRLNPGASKNELKAFEKELGAKLPRAFHELYLWRNGQRDQGHSSLCLLWSKIFMPLERIYATLKRCNALKDTDWAMTPVWWNELWVPFLESSASDYTVVDLRGSFTRKKGQIITFLHADPERAVIAPSLEDWLRQFVTSLEAGGWKNEEGIFVSPGYEFLSIPGYPKEFDAHEPDWYEQQRRAAAEKDSRRLRSRSQVYCIDAHHDAIEAIGFAPDTNSLVSCSRDVAVWNMKNGRRSRRFVIADKEIGNSVSIALSPDATTMAFAFSGSGGYGDGMIALWDLARRCLRRTIRVGSYPSDATALEFSQDRRHLAAAVKWQKCVQLRRASTGKLEWRKDVGCYVDTLALSPDGALIAATGDEEKEIMLLDTKTGSRKSSLKTKTPGGRVYHLAFWSGELLAGAYHDRGGQGVRIWNLKEKQPIWTMEDTGGPITFSPDGRYLVTGAWLGKKGCLRVWDTEVRREIAQLKGFVEEAGVVSFSRDSSLLAASDGRRILVWDFAKAIGKT